MRVCMRAQITPMTFAGCLADGSKVTRGSQKYTYWQELALARGTIAMAANQSITVNAGALSNAIAVAIQQATTDSDARIRSNRYSRSTTTSPTASIGICARFLLYTALCVYIRRGIYASCLYIPRGIDHISRY